MTSIHGSAPPTYTTVNEGKAPAEIEQSTLEAQRVVLQLMDMRTRMTGMAHDSALAASMQKELLAIEAELRGSPTGPALSAARLAEISGRLQQMQEQLQGQLKGQLRDGELAPLHTRRPPAVPTHREQVEMELKALDAFISFRQNCGQPNDELLALRAEFRGRSNLTTQDLEEMRARINKVVAGTL